MKGKILWFNKTKNYGFIKGEDDENYFVHISQLNNYDGKSHIQPDEEVDFVKANTNKGLQAHNVTFI